MELFIGLSVVGGGLHGHRFADPDTCEEVVDSTLGIGAPGLATAGGRGVSKMAISVQPTYHTYGEQYISQ